MAMIEVEDLHKNYGLVEALRGVSFKVDRGEVLGFLGPNGAGKTTCMKIITGFLAATKGTVRVDGMDVHEHGLEAKTRIGYLPENAPLYHEMRVIDYLAYAAEIRGIKKSRRSAKMNEVAASCNLKDVAGKQIGTLSKGFRQRVGLAQALIHDPEVLILDEPTAGLDPNQIVEIRELVRRLGRQRTIILSTHNLPEVLQTCDRMVIIHQGKLVADGTPSELEQSAAEDPPIVVKLKTDEDRAVVTKRLRGLSGVAKVEDRGVVDDLLTFSLNTGTTDDLRPMIAKEITAAGWTLYELKRDALDLEAIFRRLTQQI